MELTIRTLKGSCVMDVHEAITVEQLKHMLYEHHDLRIPQPEQQRLVFKQEVLPAHAALQHLGIGNGDQLVMLESRKLLKPSTPRVTPAPDAAAIRAAITEEARRWGLEHTLREERPPAAASARRNMLLTPELLGSVDGDLLQLLEQALSGSGQLQELLGGLRLSSSGDGSGQQDEEEEEDDGAEIQAPEPSAAHMAQLTDMGFSEPLARKALQLTRNQVELALEWLLQHSEEPGAADPPTQEQLRQVYGSTRRRRLQQQATGPAAIAAGSNSGATSSATPTAASAAAAAGPIEAVLSQLTEMGFDAAAAQQALSRVGPNLDLAVSLLLGQGLPAALSRGDATNSSGGGSLGSAAAAAVAGPSSAAAGADQIASVRDDTGVPVEEDEEEDEMEDAEDDEDYDDYDDEEEDEYVDYEDAEDDGVGPSLEQALGTMGSMDLHDLGSADMEQLLQGAAIQEIQFLHGNNLLVAGGVEGGMAGPQGSLLRLMEAPGLLQQMMAAVQQPSPPPEGQQQQQQQQQREEQDSGEQGQPAEQQQQIHGWGS